MKEFALVLLLAAMLLLAGCASSQPQPAKAAEQQQAGTTAQAAKQEPAKPADSGCTSPYDGTYSGIISGSGEVTHMKKDSSGYDIEDYKTPYIITYSVELTFKCASLENDYNKNGNSANPDQQFWDVYVTHAKVSDPYFGCTNGCVPISIGSNSSGQDIDGVLPLPGEHGGQLIIIFPNGHSFQIVPLYADPDAKRITGDQSQHDELISWSDMGWDWVGDGKDPDIALLTCAHCSPIPDQQGVTMTLDRIG